MNFSLVYSQIGVNTLAPKSTLDVKAKGGAADLDGFQPPRLTRADLTNKGNTLYGTDQQGTLIYINDISGGDTSGPRANINFVGYYYFDGTLWQKISSGSELGVVIGYSALVSGNQVAWPGNNIWKQIDMSNGNGPLTAWRTDNNTLTVPAGQSGKYVISYTLGLITSGSTPASYIFSSSLRISGIGGISLFKAGTTIGGGSGFIYINDMFNLSSSEVVNLNSGDTIDLRGLTYGTSGTPVGFKLSRFTLEKIE
ncbi:UNVERIFIED_CONTAM: hypothetical protein POZ17_15840 [Ralstonia mannitolilytica]